MVALTFVKFKLLFQNRTRILIYLARTFGLEFGKNRLKRLNIYDLEFSGNLL